MVGATASRPAWSVSYKEERQVAGQGHDVEPADDGGYECGNNNSEEFFRKMSTSIEQTRRLHKTCRTAAANSTARKPEEKVLMHHCNSSIEAAKAMSSFAKTATRLDDSGASVQPPALGSHSILGHLSVLQALPEPEVTSREVCLPGAVESFEEDTIPTPEATMLPAAREGTLKVHITSAKGLRAADYVGSSDPFCICTIAGRPETKLKTKIIKR
eukprot:CAMPEP_0195057770 /NCGR_PEP_ID=MMETSP0448-20130528/5817_1 /TAXON_ID=66468 /ORGANISM="Heterocapsa triquestra, Strain CCMP 448" /LENGTH=214 /DNA_ID=CAMNT_0040087813 /DNA_START=45 /DNA_END=686 /DNA_ORIENTATION=+